MQRVLFIAKNGSEYSGGYSGTYSYGSSGLFNSANFVVHMLVENGIEAKLEIVRDNNDIDREVSKYRPDVVIIEALWVIPSKFLELARLHSAVQWVVRIHSDLPFLAQEGVSVQWIREYALQDNVFIGFNSHKTLEAFTYIVPKEKLVYVPNFFPLKSKHTPNHPSKGVLNIGSFGAIRPLKNQMAQAVAAIRYANDNHHTLHFHINATRVEKGEEVLKNLRSLFRNSKHRLIEHGWHQHKSFQNILDRMDVSMCVSLSETFCLVAADSVSLGVPLVCSSEIPWAYSGSIVNPTDSKDIAKGIRRVLAWKMVYRLLNLRGLKEYNNTAVDVWLKFLKGRSR